MSTPRMTEALSSFLATVSDHSGENWSSGVNWAGISASMRERAVTLGLVTHRTRGWVNGEWGLRSGPGLRHHQHSQYSLTELGRQVVCARAFDRGLAKGWASWLEWCAERDAEHEDEVRREWGTTESAQRAIREFVMSRVEVKP